VGEAGAVGIDTGNGETRILLVVSPIPGSEPDAAVLHSALRSALPPAAVPDRVVVTDELPHANDGSGGRGKLLRRVLAEQFGDLLTAEHKNAQV
jgi:fatty-acyl-CoA synthase